MGSILRFKDENGNWVSVPALVGPQGKEGPVGPQGDPGDMSPSVYDPQGKKQDIFAYVDEVAASLKSRLSRFVTNDTSIVPTGRYATATYYNQTYGVKVGYCPDGSILLSMQGGTSTSYENIYFTLASAPAGVAIQTNNNTYDTSGDAGNLFVCWLTGITGKVEISVNMDSYNGTYDYVECAVTISSASYTEVEYIESSGTQYINTGLACTRNTRAVVDFIVTVNDNAARSIMGTAQGSTYDTPCFAISCYQGGTFCFNSTSDGWNTCDFVVGQRHHAVLDKTGGYLDGVKVFDTSRYTSDFTTSPLYLFAFNYQTPTEFGSLKMYACQLYDGDTLVRDYVPCVNGQGIYGLYDKVNEQFYTNAGSGSFTGA